MMVYESVPKRNRIIKSTSIQLIFQDLESANQQGIKARERCVEHYSIEAMASTLKSVIAQL